MEALLCAPLTLHAQPQAGFNVHGGQKQAVKSGRVVKQAALAVGRAGGASTGAALHGESSFGSRQLLAGGKFVGLRKSGFAEKRVVGQSKKLQRQAPQTIQVTVRAGLSSVPEENLGLYDPAFDKDGCGVGFVARLSKEPSRDIVSLPPLLTGLCFSYGSLLTIYGVFLQCKLVASMILRKCSDHLHAAVKRKVLDSNTESGERNERMKLEVSAFLGCVLKFCLGSCSGQGCAGDA